MIDDELLDDEEDTDNAGIPLLADDDGDVGVLLDNDDELADLTIKGENGEDLEEEDAS